MELVWIVRLAEIEQTIMHITHTHMQTIAIANPLLKVKMIMCSHDQTQRFRHYLTDRNIRHNMNWWIDGWNACHACLPACLLWLALLGCLLDIHYFRFICSMSGRVGSGLVWSIYWLTRIIPSVGTWNWYKTHDSLDEEDVPLFNALPQPMAATGRKEIQLIHHHHQQQQNLLTAVHNIIIIIIHNLHQSFSIMLFV